MTELRNRWPSAEQLAGMDRAEVETTFDALRRSHGSMSDMVTLMRKQLAAMSEHSLRASQVADLARRLNSAERGEVVRVAVMEVPHLFDARYCALYLYDYDRNELALERQNGDGDIEDHISLHVRHETVPAYAMIHREPLLVADLQSLVDWAGRDFEALSIDLWFELGALLCPLVVGSGQEAERIIGLLVLAGKESGQRFEHQDLDISVMLSELLGSSLSTCLLIEEITSLAETDGLTRLYNHRHFQQEMDKAVASAERYETPLTLVMADIDHFKGFNDTHGHQAGDQVLREVAREIRLQVRDKVDIAARYGGEEFAILMSHTALADAHVAAERLRQAIEAMMVEYEDTMFKVTLSLGVAELVWGEPKSVFIERADTALYQAKEQGRNQVVVADTSAPAPSDQDGW